jgi:hypothetical protein
MDVDNYWRLDERTAQALKVDVTIWGSLNTCANP